MSLAERRMAKGWSQEDLAEISGLSVRTIQRAETGSKLGLETLKALAASFETDVSTLITEQHGMTHPIPTSAMPDKEQRVIEDIKKLKGFYLHLILYFVILAGLGVLNYFVSPDEIWVHYVAISWAIGLAAHAISVFGMFGLFGSDWEQREFEKRMRR